MSGVSLECIGFGPCVLWGDNTTRKEIMRFTTRVLIYVYIFAAVAIALDLFILRP